MYLRFTFLANFIRQLVHYSIHINCLILIILRDLIQTTVEKCMSRELAY